MAGVVAMAAVIEDFETKQRKKPRKDSDGPGAKTITNYFSPVPKAADTHFSPPRSSNIRDYFCSKPPSLSKEKAAPPDRPKENCPKNSPQSTQPPGKPPQRRKSKAARKPQVKETVTGSVDEGSETTRKTAPLLSSDTGAAPAKPCAESLGEDKPSDGSNTGTSDAAAPTPKDNSRSLKSGKRPKVKQPPPDAPSGLQPEQPRSPPVKPRKKKSRAEKRPPPGSPEATGAQQALCDAGTEVSADEDSRLHRSTVMVSFEDFLLSQSEGDGAVGDEGETEVETSGDHLDVPLAEEDAATPPGPLKISPRTVTVHAEVHAVSAREPVKSGKRLASIFTAKRKEADGGSAASHPARAEPSAPPPPPPNSLPRKRRSNVVLQEADLVLAVVESGSAPKCSQAERRQFMAAFKRPGSEAAAKPARSQAKQEQEEAKQEQQEEEEEATGPAEPSDAPASAPANEKKAATGKKKSRRKTAPPPPSEPEAAVEGSDGASAARTPEVQKRRSRRETTTAQAPRPKGGAAAAPVPASRRPQRERSADRPPPPESPLQASTPRARRGSRGAYVAQLVSPTDTRGSPIRMRFTRIHRNASKVGTDVEQPGPVSSKTAGAAKQKSRAKRLVEEAKARRSRKAKAKAEEEEEQTSARSSSRTRSALDPARADQEDSVICVDDAQETPSVSRKTPKRKSKPRLRSLNDVLGKATAPAPKVAPLFLDRRSGKPDQGPENPPDEETCRARRQFLTSGLPDSFKKLVVKTAATREALSLSLSCASFQPVVHVLQAPQGCPLWSLPWPASPALRSVREDWGLPSGAVRTPGGPLQPSTAPAPRAPPDPGAADQRPALSDPLRLRLLEEIRSSHPSFPAQRFLTGFLRRRDLHLPQTTTTATSTTTTAEPPPAPGGPADPLGGTRKRKAEGDASGKVAKKKKRSSLRAEEDERRAATPPPPEPPRRGRRRRQKEEEEQEEEQGAKASESACTPAPQDSVIVLEDSPLGGGGDAPEDVTREELLWTEKYQPQHSGDLIGNTAAVRKLHSWLKEWKLRADREERVRQKEARREEEGHDPDWDCGGESSQDPEDVLCNTLLISGPSGAGKTAAVYACALELGFKVFEVNASSQRSGRLILSQLKEATQSHQVDIHGPNAHKPSYFSSYSSAGTRSGPSPRKVNSPRRVVSSPGKPPPSPRGARRGALAPTALASFFKLGRPGGTREPSPPTAAPKKPSGKTRAPAVVTTPLTAGDGGGGGAKDSPAGGGGAKDSPAGGGGAKDSPAGGGGPEASKKTATSLILFEEVDVIFDEDAGFLGAIKTFMTTTKRPVILTTSDPHFSSMFDGYLEEVHFTAPSMDDASSYLRLLCLTEDTPTRARDVSTLLRLNRGDIRQSLLQLQFWSRSSRGRRGATPPDPLPEALAPDAEVRSQPQAGCGALPDPPRWDRGCAESMLGLPNLRPHLGLHQLLEEPDACWEMLADSRRRGVDLLYSNMHTLLPLPQLPLPPLPQLPLPPLPQLPVDMSTPPSPISSARTLPEADLVGVAPVGGATVSVGVGVALAGVGGAPDDGSPVKVSQRMRKHKRLAPKDLHSGSDSGDDFLSLAPPQGAPPQPPPPPRKRREPPTPQQRAVSGPVSAGLAAIARFLDDVSRMDACSAWGQGAPGAGAAAGQGPVRDGMVDEAPLEGPGAGRAEAERTVEIQAAVEALSFRRCLAAVTEAQREAQALGGGGEVEQAALELSLPVADHQRGFSLTPASPCQPQLLRRCRETSGTLRARGAFVPLGSRPELFLDYLPALRAVCRAEQLKEQGKVKRRFLHYLDSIHLGLSRDTLQDLASPFP